MKTSQYIFVDMDTVDPEEVVHLRRIVSPKVHLVCFCTEDVSTQAGRVGLALLEEFGAGGKLAFYKSEGAVPASVVVCAGIFSRRHKKGSRLYIISKDRTLVTFGRNLRRLEPDAPIQLWRSLAALADHMEIRAQPEGFRRLLSVLMVLDRQDWAQTLAACLTVPAVPLLPAPQSIQTSHRFVAERILWLAEK